MRTFLYHNDCPKGRIFTDEQEYEDAMESGWVEAPWLINGAKESLPDVEPLKPWQKAQAARKANKAKREGGLK